HAYDEGATPPKAGTPGPQDGSGARLARRRERLSGGARSPEPASASISTFISGFKSAETATIVAAGRIAPKTSPCTVTTASQYETSVTKVRSRTISARSPPASFITLAKVA